MGSTPFAGVLLAVNSAGSAVGGLIYGAMHIRAHVDRLASRLLALIVLPLALHAMTASPGCSSCSRLLQLVDRAGVRRVHDPGHFECAISLRD
jgi:hypothetical protein